MKSYKLPPLFNWIKETANIDFFELAKTFNCGIGFLIFAEKSDVDTIIKNVNDVGYNSFLIGKMVEKKSNRDVIFDGWGI